MLTTREEVERVGKLGVEVKPHAKGYACRMLNRYWVIADTEDHGFTPHAKQDGFWEAWITAWMARELSSDHIFVDVGANVGYYALFAASLGCRTVAYEPQHTLAERVAAAADMNGWQQHLSVVNAAIGDKPGRMTLNIPRHHGMNASITHWGYTPSGEYTSYEVDVLPLDTLRQWMPNRPMLIKIDAEGAEPLVWAGMQELLEREGKTTVLMEYRWDRYPDPMLFASQLFDQFLVSHVDYDAREVPLAGPFALSSREHEDWMLVLRKP